MLRVTIACRFREVHLKRPGTHLPLATLGHQLFRQASPLVSPPFLQTADCRPAAHRKRGATSIHATPTSHCSFCDPRTDLHPPANPSTSPHISLVQSCSTARLLPPPRDTQTWLIMLHNRKSARPNPLHCTSCLLDTCAIRKTNRSSVHAHVPFAQMALLPTANLLRSRRVNRLSRTALA